MGSFSESLRDQRTRRRKRHGAALMMEELETRAMFSGASAASFTSSGVIIGAVEFGTIPAGYALRVSDQVIPVMIAGRNASSTYPGNNWIALGARSATSGGYELLWRNSQTGDFAGWTLDSAAVLQTGRKLSMAELYAIETEESMDIDGDALIGTPPVVFTPGNVKIGQVEFGSIPAGYALRVGDQVIPVRFGGRNASDTNPGNNWRAIGARSASSGGGFDLLWKNSLTGAFAGWSLSAAGALQSGRQVGLTEFFGIEIAENLDVDGDGHIGMSPFTPGGMTIEGVELGSISAGYALRVASTEVIPVTIAGRCASDTNPGNQWKAIGARPASTGGGYELFWKNVRTGAFARWSLNAGGALQSGSGMKPAEFYGIETGIGLDVDRDDWVGAPPLDYKSSGVKLGDVTLGSRSTGYVLKEGSRLIPVVINGKNASESNPGRNWKALAASATPGTYEMYWKNSQSSACAVWSLDFAGGFLSGRSISLSDFYESESVLSADIDRDGQIGTPPFTSSGVTIGEVEFGTVPAGYALRVSGAVLPVMISGRNASLVNPGNNWEAVGAQPAGSGSGYEVLWVSPDNARPFAEYGKFAMWTLNANGALTTGRGLSLSEIFGLEDELQTDIDGNGKVGASSNVKLGAIGDSLIDEHFDQGIGYSKNWYEMMVGDGRIDGGQLGSDQPGGQWSEKRGSGYEFNFAEAGSTIGSVVDDGQHTGLAELALSNGIGYAVFIVGANDFFPEPGLPYDLIYNGQVSQQTINQVVAQAIESWKTAVSTLQSAGIKVVASTIPDYGIAPYTHASFPDAAKRERVTSVIRQINATSLRAAAASLGVPLIDVFTLTRDIWGGNGSERQTLNLGGATLQLKATAPNSSNTTAAFAHDGIHPMNTIGGVFANLVMEAFNTCYGESFQLFTEREILELAGSGLLEQYNGSKLETTLGKSLSSYVIKAPA